MAGIYHGSDQSEDSDGPHHHYLSCGSSSSSTTSTSTNYFTCASTTSNNAGKDSGKTSQDSSSDDSSDYDEKTDEFLGAPPPGQKFSGKLAAGERWLMCPYYPAHFYICNQYITHLYTCRAKYLKEKRMKDANADVVICRFDSMHHGPKAKLKKHELNCDKGSMYFMYLDYFIERQRYSKYMGRKEAGKEEVEPKEEVDDGDKQKVEGGKDDTVEEKEDTQEDDSDDNRQDDDDLDFY